MYLLESSWFCLDSKFLWLGECKSPRQDMIYLNSLNLLYSSTSSHLLITSVNHSYWQKRNTILNYLYAFRLHFSVQIAKRRDLISLVRHLTLEFICVNFWTYPVNQHKDCLLKTIKLLVFFIVDFCISFCHQCLKDFSWKCL